MESNQPRIEDVASDNIVERELQPPNPLKRKKKKVPFAVWLEQQELKVSADNTEPQDVSLITENESIAKAMETLDQKDKKGPSTVKPKDNIQADNLTEVPDDQTAENVQRGCLNEIQNLPHSSDKTSPANCSCLAKFKETELKYKEMQKYLMTQLDEMFDTNKKLSAKLRQQQELVRKLSESRQSKDSMVSAQIQRDYQEIPKKKTLNYQSASVQTEMDGQETRYPLKPVSRTISTQTEMDVLETRGNLKPSDNKMEKYLMKQLDEMFDTNKKLSAKLRQQQELARKGLSESRQSKRSMVSVQTQTDWQEIPKQKTANYQSASTQTEMDLQESSYPVKPVSQSISTQTEMDLQETSYELKPVSQTTSQTEMDLQESSYPLKPVSQSISTQTEISLVLQNQPSETPLNGHQDQLTKIFQRSTGKNRTESAMKAACELEIPNKENDEQEVSILGTVVDHIASIKTYIHMIETEIAKVEQIDEKETVSETQLSGDQQDDKKPSKKSKCKNKRKAAMKAACEPETLNNIKVSVEDTEEDEVSIPENFFSEIFGDETASIIPEIHRNETVIGELQQAAEDKMVTEIQQNEDQPDDKRPLTKSKCKKKRKTAKKAKLETVVNKIETDQNLIHSTETPKSDLETLEIPQTASEQLETKSCKVSEDVTGRVPVVSTEGESGLVEKQKTSPPQMNVTFNKDRIQTTPEESETQAAGESAEQNSVSEPEESPMKKISLWRRIKKALTPSCLRQFKDRSNIHPA